MNYSWRRTARSSVKCLNHNVPRGIVYSDRKVSTRSPNDRDTRHETRAFPMIHVESSSLILWRTEGSAVDCSFIETRHVCILRSWLYVSKKKKASRGRALARLLRHIQTQQPVSRRRSRRNINRVPILKRHGLAFRVQCRQMQS